MSCSKNKGTDILKPKIQNLKSKINFGWGFLLILGLIIAGQVNYLPGRLAFFEELLRYAQADAPTSKARLAYSPANYDLLDWVRSQTPPEATLLLVTTSPAAYGDPTYVLYHRAIYHLGPRSVWWAAPVPPTRYPVWWSETDLSPQNIQTLATQRQATVVLTAGFRRPPIPGPFISFDPDTHLIFLEGNPASKRAITK